MNGREIVEMLERIARAIAPRLQGRREYDGMPVDKVMLRAWLRSGEVLDVNDATRDDAIDAARAIVTAMREPTSAMLDSGVAFALQASVHGFGGWSNYVAEKHRAMIDAALRPT